MGHLEKEPSSALGKVYDESRVGQHVSTDQEVMRRVKRGQKHHVKVNIHSIPQDEVHPEIGDDGWINVRMPDYAFTRWGQIEPFNKSRANTTATGTSIDLSNSSNNEWQEMTASEFKAWFDGFIEGISGHPTPEQFERIKAKVAEMGTQTAPKQPVAIPSIWQGQQAPGNITYYAQGNGGGRGGVSQ